MAKRLLADEFKGVASDDFGYHESAWEAAAAAPLDMAASLVAPPVKPMDMSGPSQKTEQPADKNKQNLSSQFKASAKDMKSVTKLESDKATTQNPGDIANEASVKTDLAQQDLKQMEVAHKEQQQGPNQNVADPASNGGSAVGDFVKDAGIGIAAASTADAVCGPGAGAAVAAVMTCAQGFDVARRMMGAGTFGSPSTNELSRSIAKSVGGKHAKSDPGYNGGEASPSEYMGGSHSPMQATLDKLSNIPGMKTPTSGDIYGRGHTTSADLNGYVNVPFKETPEAKQTMAALNDGCEATTCYLRRVDKGIAVTADTMEVAMNKDISPDQLTAIDKPKPLNAQFV